MVLISPVDHLEETAALLDAGADELYGGCLPAAWAERFGLLASVNQRTFAAAQIGSLEELREIVAQAHARGRRFALTLNAPFYSDAQNRLLLELVEHCVAAGIDGIILADLGLLRQLRERHPGLEYHASTLAHLGNSAAVRFYARQGMGRVILPRHLTVSEMAAIARAVPEVRCDAFMLVGNCPNTEGLCTHHHCNPDRIWPCEQAYRIAPEAGDAGPGLAAAMTRQAAWAQTNRRHGCGLCGIPALLEAGFYGLKLVGRGAPTLQKVRNLLLVRDFLEHAAAREDFARYRQRARAAHRRRFSAPCSTNVCYYPEFYEED